MNGGNSKRIDRARDALVGIIPDPKGQVEQITTALIYKFLHELDCRAIKAGGRRSFFVGKYAAFAWDKLLSPQMRGDERLALYRRAVESMAANEKLPPVFREMLRGAHSPFRNAPVLKLFLDAIDELDCAHTEDLGDAYEHLLSIMGTQGDTGQFRTPRHIIDFIVAVVNPQKGGRILDPACGSGGFLTAAHKHIMDANTKKSRGDMLTQAEKTRLPKNIFGLDIDPGMARLATVNLYLHGVKTPQVREYDSLSDDSFWNEKHDFILANPPFMSPKGGIRPHGRFMISARRAEILFVDYIAEHLSPGGRTGVIVPAGILDKPWGTCREMRKMLVQEWGLYAVASLPAGVFQPYSGVETSVLFLDRKRRGDKKILFVKVENDGFNLGATRAPIAGSQLPQAQKIIDGWRGDAIKNKIAHTVAKDKIAQDGEYNLVGDSYLRPAVNVGKYPMVRVKDAILPVKQRPGIPKSQWKEEGKFSVIDQSMNSIAGYWDNPDDVIRVSTPMIAFGLHTRRFKYVDFDFVLGAQGVKLLLPKPEFNPAFFYHACRNLDIKNLGYAIHWKELKAHYIPLPPMAVQERIVTEIAEYEKARNDLRKKAEKMEQKIAAAIAKAWGDKA